jgi:hypothetical protein
MPVGLLSDACRLCDSLKQGLLRPHSILCRIKAKFKESQDLSVAHLRYLAARAVRSAYHLALDFSEVRLVMFKDRTYVFPLPISLVQTSVL